jgi:hypothetical protein
LYHPLLSGSREAEIAVTVGAVASRFIVTTFPVMVLSVNVTVQETSLLAVSASIVASGQSTFFRLLPETLNDTVTVAVYQPALHGELTPETLQLDVIVASACAAAGSVSTSATSPAAVAVSLMPAESGRCGPGWTDPPGEFVASARRETASCTNPSRANRPLAVDKSRSNDVVPGRISQRLLRCTDLSQLTPFRRFVHARGRKTVARPLNSHLAR